MEEEIVDIRVRLADRVRDQFLAIKEAKGLTNNTDVIRLVITDYYKRMKRKA